MRLVLSISEKAARALRVAAAKEGCRGVSAYVELLYGGDPLPEAPFKGTLKPEEHALAWENIKRAGLVPSEEGPKVSPFVTHAGKVTDCGFGPDTYTGIDRAKDEFWKSGLIDAERAKELYAERDKTDEGHE